MAYSNKGDAPSASRYATEYRKRATPQALQGIDSNPPPPETPPAFLKYH